MNYNIYMNMNSNKTGDFLKTQSDFLIFLIYLINLCMFATNIEVL